MTTPTSHTTMQVSTARKSKALIYWCSFIGELHTMMRPKTDLMSKTLARLHKAFVAASNKQSHNGKKKTSKQVRQSPNSGTSTDMLPHTVPAAGSVPGESGVRVIKGHESVDISQRTNLEFGSGMDIVITIPSSRASGQAADLSLIATRLRVLVNPPMVTIINCFPRKQFLANYPIVPTSECEHADGVEYSWYGQPPMSNGGPVRSSTEFELLSSEPVFVPKDEHIGYCLKVYCTPWKRDCKADPGDTPDPQPHVATDIQNDTLSKVFGRSTVLYLSGSVARNDHSGLIADRQSYRTNFCRVREGATTESSNDVLRIVSYNVLADTYASRNYAHTHMYPYCSPADLEFEIRAQKNLRECARYGADVLCLQECESKLFDTYLNPYFKSTGYAGTLSLHCYSACV
jgi:hypothetical protein